MIFYRLGMNSALPTHWSYADVEEGLIHEGFQVWADADRVVSVAAGESCADGEYPASAYPVLFVVDASEVDDGGDEWYAVKPESIISVSTLDTQSVIDWVRSQVEEEEEFEDWCEENPGEIERFILDNATKITPTFSSTLGVS